MAAFLLVGAVLTLVLKTFRREHDDPQAVTPIIPPESEEIVR
jgi:hypothetical protein